MISKCMVVGKQFKILVISKIPSIQARSKMILIFKIAKKINKQKKSKILIKFKRFKESLSGELSLHRHVNKLINMLLNKA